MVAGVAVVLAAEEVVEADLVQAGRAGERAEVATDAVGGLVGAHHHRRCVPADEGADAALDVLVAGEPRLVLARDGVDVGRRHRGGEADLASRARSSSLESRNRARVLPCESMTASRLSSHSGVSPGSVSGS